MPALHQAPDCPNEARLAQFIEGNLDGEQLATMEKHLASCPDCLQLVGNAGQHVSDAAFASTVYPGIEDTPPPVAPETRVGRYIVRSAVGAGAMGRVYAAYDPTLDREVALKLLHPSAGNPDLEARLLREAKSMARLAHHPEVVPVYDAGRHGAQLFIAMEFVEGGTLRGWLKARRRSWREIVAVFLRAGRGLAHAHAAGLVHRDFKPDNVLVGRDGRVRVTDFGLARVVRDGAEPPPSSRSLDHRSGRAVEASLTRTGTLVGTPAYMAPEQLHGGNTDARSDIFSFCVALYEAVHGERPFKGSTIAQLLDSTSTGQISPPPGDRGVPRALSRVLRVGLRPRPEDRHSSMPVLLEAIERATGDPSLMLRRVGIAGSLVAAAGALVVIPFARRAPRMEPAPSAALAAVTLGSAAGTPSGANANANANANAVGIVPAVAASALPAPDPSAIAVAPGVVTLPPVVPLASRSPARPRPARERVAPVSDTAAPVVAPTPSARPDCNPNYYFDKNGKKHFKAECFE